MYQLASWQAKSTGFLLADMFGDGSIINIKSLIYEFSINDLQNYKKSYNCI
ncbi:MAG: hypothetical protein KIT33_10270 [Candidatus Kapabacteria bacterium]|nr:hypothetical protein [Ignavibacteriota bacterium]MCW5885343.1 hypothetical protein [Candidatus Kapabacteria bacterium]